MTRYISSAAAAADAVQQGKVGIAAVARVVVDAQIDMAAVAGHAVALAKQLQPGHVHGNHRFRLELALEQVRIGKGIAGRDRVGAEHRCILVQSFQGIIQGAAAADGITVRVFVAQDQNVVGRLQALGHLLHTQRFRHPMFHPFRKAVKCVLLLGLPGFGLCLGLTADVQAA